MEELWRRIEKNEDVFHRVQVEVEGGEMRGWHVGVVSHRSPQNLSAALPAFMSYIASFNS